jgi:branched-chain amino acid transport system substrate-binding protein
MHVIYEMVKKLGGKVDGGKALDAVKGMTIQSPRGTITIDAATRDVIQDVYVRKVERVGDKHFNVEFDKFPKVKDPGKP